MRKIFYLLLFPICLTNSSCTMVVKGLAKSVSKSYDDQKDLNVSNLQLVSRAGNTESFGSLYAGKTVYMYVWKHKELLAPGDTETYYLALKQRFEKYKDVVFINLYTGDKDEDWKEMLAVKNTGVYAYRLAPTATNDTFRTLMGSSTSPQIIGKDGTVLGFRGPLPHDKLVVDYALYQARTGEDATTSTNTLIKGINSKIHFKKKDLSTWYENHFGQKPTGKLNVSISGSKSNVDAEAIK